MATGTSVIGMQKLIDQQVSSLTSLTIYETNRTSGEPSQDGIIYLIQRPTTPAIELIRFRDRIITPGSYWLLTNLEIANSTRIIVWANWDEAGISWTCTVA